MDRMVPAPHVMTGAHRPYKTKQPRGMSPAFYQHEHPADINAQHPPLINGPWQAKNKRNYARLRRIQPEDESCFLQPSTFSQFQVYCRAGEPSSTEVLGSGAMQWPLLVRFFDNFSIPGYAILISQARNNDRYTGEAYWVGWEIPYWMSLPSFLLTDDEKRKLTLYWIARQRLQTGLYRYQKLSVMMNTYYPTRQQLTQRRDMLANADPPRPLYALQQSMNPPGSPPVSQILRSLDREYLVYYYQTNKGGDLARNKSMPLSFILDNPERIQMPSDPWLTQPFGPSAYTWTNTFRPDTQENDPDVLQDFLNAYEPWILNIFQTFHDRVLELMQANPDVVASALNQDPSNSFFQEFLEAREVALTQATPDTLANEETLRLMQDILFNDVPVHMPRFTSSSVLIQPRFYSSS